MLPRFQENLWHFCPYCRLFHKFSYDSEYERASRLPMIRRGRGLCYRCLRKPITWDLAVLKDGTPIIRITESVSYYCPCCGVERPFTYQKGWDRETALNRMTPSGRTLCFYCRRCECHGKIEHRANRAMERDAGGTSTLSPSPWREIAVRALEDEDRHFWEDEGSKFVWRDG